MYITLGAIVKKTGTAGPPYEGLSVCVNCSLIERWLDIC